MIEEIAKSMFIASKDIALDYLELGLDAITDSKVIEAIPVAKTIYSLFDGCRSIRDRFFLEKMIRFVEEIKKGNTNIDAFNDRRKAAEKGEEWLYKEVELLILAIDRLDNASKSELVARTYLSYLNNNVDSKTFLELLSIIDRWFETDSELLSSYLWDNVNKWNNVNKENLHYREEDKASYSRMTSLGVMNAIVETRAGYSPYVYKATTIGMIFVGILNDLQITPTYSE